MPDLRCFSLNGPLIHPKIKKLLNESKFDLSDDSTKPQIFPSLMSELDFLPLDLKLALAEACLERVSLAVFAGCLKIEDFRFDENHTISRKFNLNASDFDSIQNVIKMIDENFDSDPLAVFVQLRSGATDVHPLTYYIQYFFLAYVLLFVQEESVPRDVRETLLRLKFLYVYANILSDPCPVIKKRLDDLLERMDSLGDLLLEEQVEFSLILANGFLIYSDIAKAIESCSHAKKLAGVEFDFSGELGKRTYFQQKDLAQLFAKASLNCQESDFTSGSIADDTPTALKLDDDTVMTEIRKTNPNDESEGRPELYPVHLACMITSLIIMQKNEAPDEILFEKAEAFVHEILKYRMVYGVQLRALLARCMVECERKRKVERACMQGEVLKNDLFGIHTANGNNVTLNVEQYRPRLPWLLASNAKPFWFYCRSYASILLRLGGYSEALRIYNDIYDYDSLVECYISIGQADKAETMVRNLLEIKETSFRLCLMGVITKDPIWYEKAIKISNDNSAQARTNLGLIMMHREKLEEAYEHLKRAVEIKPFQISTLFALGHVAYKLEKYSDAAVAYRKYVNVEPNDFEPWNNLSASFVHLNKPEQAHRTMKEALKFNRNHPEMWKNYVIMSINIGDYGQAIYAVQEYMKCAKKLDICPIVQKLLLSIIQIRDETKFEVLQKEAILMMGQLSSKIILDADTLCFYALLKKPADNCDDQNIWLGYINIASKAIQKSMTSTNWQSDENVAFNTLQLATDILSAERKLNLLKPEGQKVAEHPARVVSILKWAKSNYGNEFNNLENDRLRNLLKIAEEMV